MKTPQDFGIDQPVRRYENGLLRLKQIFYYDTEEFIRNSRTRFAEDNFDIPALPKEDIHSQQFLIAAKKVFLESGDDGLRDFFIRYADYLIMHLPLYKKIDEWRDYNSRIIAYNDYVCEQSGNKLVYEGTHPDYISEVLKRALTDWEVYWDYYGSDNQSRGGEFRHYYAGYGIDRNIGNKERSCIWAERCDYFYDTIARGFLERINEEIAKREHLTIKQN